MKQRLLLLLAIALAAPGARAQLVGTAFTYQGALTVSGQPANGSFDLRFDAYVDAASASPLNAQPIVLDDIAISNGVFSVDIDFGKAVFLGAPVFLEIGVRPGTAGGVGDPGGFQGLVPRTRVRPAPYALHAERVAIDSIGTNEIGDGTIGIPDIDTAQVQRRVGGACGSGFAIRSVAADGSVVCEPLSTFAAGNGISSAALSGGTIAIDPIVVPSKDPADGNQAFDGSVLFLDYVSNRVGVNTATPGVALDVAGNVRGTTYNQPATTGHYSIAGTNFIQDRVYQDNDIYDVFDVYGSVSSPGGIHEVRLTASVRLPDNVTPGTMSCEVYDNDAAQNLTLSANLRRHAAAGANTNGDALGSITTTGASTAIQTFSDAIAFGGGGSAQNTYTLVVVMTQTAPSSSLRFYGCRVSYAYTRLGV